MLLIRSGGRAASGTLALGKVRMAHGTTVNCVSQSTAVMRNPERLEASVHILHPGMLYAFVLIRYEQLINRVSSRQVHMRSKRFFFFAVE